MKRAILFLSVFQLTSFTSEAKIGPSLKPAVTAKLQKMVRAQGIDLTTEQFNTLVKRTMAEASMKTLEKNLRLFLVK